MGQKLPLKPWTRLDWLIIFIFALLVMLFYWRILTPDLADRQSFPPGDFQAQFWAFTTFEVRELGAGRLPLWNPYTFAGAPFWADVQAAVFYPPSLLTLLLSAPWGFSLFALEIEAIVHFWLAALFMYLFSRQITGSRAAAAISALTFTFSGYLTGYPSQQLAVLEANVWLPLILFFLHRAFHPGPAKPTMNDEFGMMNPSSHFLPPPSLLLYPLSSLLPPLSSILHSLSSILLAGLTWGLVLLAGHPQSALIIAYVSLAYLTFLWFTLYPMMNDESRTMNHRSSLPGALLGFIIHHSSFIIHLSLFLLTGLCLAAIQFIPAVEYTLRSVRAEGAYDKMAGGFPITDIIQLLLPGQVSFYSPLYIGLVGLSLALAVSLAAPSRHTTFWAIIAFAALLISFGGNTFLYSPLYLFTPGFSIFRGQERWAFAAAFSLSVLAGYGFKELIIHHEQLTKNPPSTPHSLHTTHYTLRITHYTSPFTYSVLRFTQYLLLLSFILTFLSFYGLNDTGWRPGSPFYKLLNASTLLTLLLVLTWLLWRFSAYLHPTLLTLLTAALVCFDLFTANWQTNLYPQLPEQQTQIPAVVAAIKKDAAQFPDEPYRVYNEFRLYDNYGLPFEIEDLWGASPLRPDRYDQFLAPPMPIERTWELLNVKYVITWRQTLYPGTARRAGLPSTIIYQEPANDGLTYVHRLDAVTPRTWLAGQVEMADDLTILQKIADPNFDRWGIALLEPDAAPDLAALQPGQPRPVQEGQAHVSRFVHDPSHLTYQVTTPTPALLVMSETYYPGWQATLDGQPAPLLRADYILRAVPVPAGEHTIRVTFWPRSFTIGAIITASSLLILALIFISSLFLQRRLSAQPAAGAGSQALAETGQGKPDRQVFLCRRPVTDWRVQFLFPGIEHYSIWLPRQKLHRGVTAAGLGYPLQWVDEMYFDPNEGQSEIARKGYTCDAVPGADITCIEREVIQQQDEGRYSLSNQCQNIALNALMICGGQLPPLTWLYYASWLSSAR